MIYDHNENQHVDSSKELVLTKWCSTAKTDFEALLCAFDTNKDKILDINDKEFGKFFVWQDKNQNGISESDELKTLSDSGIESINFNTQQKANFELVKLGILSIADVYWISGNVTKAYDLLLESEYNDSICHDPALKLCGE